MVQQIAYRKAGSAWQALLMEDGKVIKSYIRLWNFVSESYHYFIDRNNVENISDEDKKVFDSLEEYIKEQERKKK